MLLTINEMFVNRKLIKGGEDNSVPRVGGKGVGFVRKYCIYRYNLIHRSLILKKPGHVKVKKVCIKRVLNQDC